jgi:hypothetical protein
MQLMMGPARCQPLEKERPKPLTRVKARGVRAHGQLSADDSRPLADAL